MFVYQVYDNNSGIRLVYKKVVCEDPVLLDTVDSCCYTPMLVDNKLIFIWESGVADVIDGNVVNRRYFNNFRVNYNKLVFFNNEIYALNTNDNNQPIKLIITDNQVTFDDLEVVDNTASRLQNSGIFTGTKSTGQLTVKNSDFTG